ncbi:DUF2218 domain-containing protein [Phytopseudomonas dryadis]|uniref:DUF2218 domain-containing protein n=1 Tax=Phytopseudomonas dryadis TaxID=2487520 RepID=A0A4Q9R8T1_9GAMM|nr:MULTISPECIES: DUF2218 domain-containing protein [Pseudomonas]TBU97096.1 DUF2218 domain-containing protein [Pseudomonas dryadis]TBV08567.1 DUF2218 domain-containing protein [Pseudomonas dryadis]TBV18935.1 DUF2218 domain-containing protein [Pseudomonas sp. FRB 230]
MIRFQGCVATASASLYMSKLCKHFRHKISVEFDEQQARAEFPFGLCLMRADDRTLRFDCEAPSEEAAARIRAVLDDHLPRFARKEDLSIDWHERLAGR